MPRAAHPMELRLDQIVVVGGERWRVDGIDGSVILLTRYCFASMRAGPQPRCMAALSEMMRLTRCSDGFRDAARISRHSMRSEKIGKGKNVEVVLIARPTEN